MEVRIPIEDHVTYVDPGKKYFGAADFHGGELVCTYFGRNEEYRTLLCGNYGVIEMPWGSTQKNAKDIRDLCVWAGRYAERFTCSWMDDPGKSPKPIRHAQALSRLTEYELSKLPKLKGHRKHVLCAVWMGLKHSGRLVACTPDGS